METPTTPEGMTGALIPRPNDTATTDEIATLIETAMTIHGFTQSALAVAMGISSAQLSSSKNGRYGLGSDPLARLRGLAARSDAPLQLGPRSVGWREDVVLGWIESRVTGTRPFPTPAPTQAKG